MFTARIELIRHAHKTCLEFITTEASSEHVSEQVHSHSTIEIACIAAGCGVYSVSNQGYPFMAGDVFVFNSMEQHNICSIASGETLRTIAINFDPEFIAPMDGSDYDLQFLDAFFYTNRPCMLGANDACAQDIARLLGQMALEFDAKRPCYQLVVKAQLLGILAVYLRAFKDVGGDGDKLELPVKRQDSIATVLSYIEANLSSDLSIDLLSSLVHMNRYYFSTFFKKYVGETPVQYISRKRVVMAMTLLEETTLSVLEIAIRCGFNNSSNFNRVFKQISGMNPSDYKKRR